MAMTDEITIRHAETDDYEALNRVISEPRAIWGTIVLPFEMVLSLASPRLYPTTITPTSAPSNTDPMKKSTPAHHSADDLCLTIRASSSRMPSRLWR